MDTKNVVLRLKGVSPLILHNGDMADPLNPSTKRMKKFSGKRDKTEADYDEMAKIEWEGGLYVNDKDRIVVRSTCIEATLISGAKKKKKGEQFKSGIRLEDNPELIIPDPYVKYDDLWGNPKYRLTCGVRVQRNRIMRTRPIFPDWELNVTVVYIDSILNKVDVIDVAKLAGAIVGMCDWRPKYGRFVVEEV